MKTPIAIALLAILALAASPAAATERACRPSLSNFYHCPDTSAPATKSKETTGPSGRACRPSVSNFWTCPGTSQPRQKSAGTSRACRPSLSNGYSCPGTSAPSAKPDNGGGAPKKTATTPGRGCRPSLSNGYKCPEAQTGDNQYATETLAWAHCPTDTVVWANTRSDVYHFRGAFNYGNTKAGAYMCEQDSLAEGMRAAKNEKHP
jgi:hypothetical protein